MSGDHNMNQTDSAWRKRQIALDKKAENARELGLDYDIHSCSYYCDRPECIKAQRDKLRDKLARPEQTEVQRLIALVRAQQITIDKLEMALAQPKQEPDYNICPTCGGMASDPIVPPEQRQPAPVQEPTFYRHKDGHFMNPERAKFLGLDLNDLQALYTTPPPVAEPHKRTWVGLTEADIDDLAEFHGLDFMSYEPFTRAIEAKLRSKNEHRGR